MASDERRKKLLNRKKKLKEKSEGGNLIFIKADETIRVRPLPVDEDEEFGAEVTQFYLGNDIKGVFSPSTFGEPCPIMEMYEELKNGDDADKDLASKLKPKQKFVVPVIKYDDNKGKKVDEKNSGKLLLLTAGTYQDLIDLYLDDEQGDFTDPKNGYDIKITRSGAGQFDTEYSTIPCRPSKIPKAYNKPHNIEDLIRKEIRSYEDIEALLNQFLGVSDEPKKKKKKKASKDAPEKSTKKKKSSTKKKSSKKK